MIHLRHHTATYAAPQLQIPQDVVWLKRATTACALLLGCLLVFLVLRSLILAPWFAINTLHLRGDTQFHNSLTIRANVLQQLSGNYFTLNLKRVQNAFESLPWIRSAVVQRVFPNQLMVKLTAHVPVARWVKFDTEAETYARDSESESEAPASNGLERLVNEQGELFDASGGSLAVSDLPILSGPDQRASELLTTFKTLQSMLAQQNLKITRITIDPLQGWHAQLENKAILTFGQGSGTEIVERAQRWLEHWPALRQQYEQPLQSVDLRYQYGFSVRLAGVTTGMKAK
jgi:cell division protein FtsQ